MKVGIVGGGVAGCAAAVGLARVGCSVVVIERTAYEHTRIGETLPPRARVLLEQLGVWQQFCDDGHLPASGSLAAWGSEELHESQYLFNPYGPGWHLDRRQFESRFAQWAEDAGARVLRNSRVKRIRSLADRGWRLDVECETGQEPMDVSVLMDASGRASLVGRCMGATRTDYDKLVALFAYFRVPSRANDTRTMVEATRNGWWYSSYLPEAGLVVAYLTDSDLLPHGARGSLHIHWARELEATTYTRGRVDGATRTTEVRTTRANTYQMSLVSGENWLAIGDAAMAFDPLSSQGIYNALRSAIEASRALQQHVGGDSTEWHRYPTGQQQRFKRYLSARTAYYRREMRWCGSPFWERRVLDR